MQSKNERILIRLHQVIGCRKRGISSIVPISSSVWWKLVREKKAPQPVKIGKATAWYRDEVFAYVDSLSDKRN